MIHEAFQQMKKQLGQMDKWFEAAAAHADAKKFDSKNFLGIRLIVDQLPLSFQVQTACDTVKMAAARLSGKVAPSHPDTEQTLDELRTRIKSVIGYLDGFSAEDFAAAETRSITLPRWEGKWMTGADYFREHAQPNFFFHVTTVYAILRQNAVQLGKRDFLGALTQHPPA